MNLSQKYRTGIFSE